MKKSNCIFVIMKSPRLHIDLSLMAVAFREYVRKKAIEANSTIVYLEKDEIIEEDPKSKKKSVLRKLHINSK